MRMNWALAGFFLTFSGTAMASIDGPFCVISVSEQPELGSTVEPGKNSFIEVIRKSWLGKDGAVQGALGKFAVYDVHQDFRSVFGKTAVHSPRLAELQELRMKHIPELSAFRERRGVPRSSELWSLDASPGSMVEQNGVLMNVNDEGLRRWLQAVHDELYFRAGKFRLTRQHYLLPGVFVNKKRLGNTSEELRVWTFDFRREDHLSRYVQTTAYKEKQIDFEEWARILSAYGVMPVAPSGQVAYHDFFGHVLAAIAHPYEELVLQKKFYDRLVREMDGLASEHRKPYLDLHFEAANILFESLELPKFDALKNCSVWKNPKNRTRFEPYRDSKTGMLQASLLIQSQERFSQEMIQTLREFREKILLENDSFYRSADFYGGDFYDLLNHFRDRDGIKNYIDPKFGFGLEHLRYRALQCDQPICAPLLRLFVAYVNATERHLTYEKVLDAAIGDQRKKSKNGYPVPWMGGMVEEYWRSYTGPGFHEELDRWFAPHR